jgi:hypothetical protein
LPVKDAPPVSLNQVACEYLLSGGSSKSIYIEMSELLEKLAASSPPALCELASITDFDLYICGTIDSLLAAALERPVDYLKGSNQRLFIISLAAARLTQLCGLGRRLFGIHLLSHPSQAQLDLERLFLLLKLAIFFSLVRLFTTGSSGYLFSS